MITWMLCSVADLGGDASPPTSLKVTILAKKSASILNNSAPVRDASPPTSLNLTHPAENSLSISVKTFFFYLIFFGDHLILGEKKRLSFRLRPKNHSQFRWRPFFFFFGDHLILGHLKRLNFGFRPKNHSQFRWRPFFFFFGDHLILGEKNAWISDFGRKITLNFGEDIRIFEVLCLKSPPTKIF